MFLKNNVFFEIWKISEFLSNSFGEFHEFLVDFLKIY